MGLLDIFKSNGNGQFVSDKAFQRNLARQVELAPETLRHLKNYGVSDDCELKLEFFFYAKTEDKAQLLADALKKINYEVEFGQSAGDKKLFLITGWTTKMKMDDGTVRSWAKEMCELGYKFDCEFDGWGTTPDQDQPRRHHTRRQQECNLDKMIYKIPNQNNLYGTIFNIDSKKALADMLGASGWSIRKSTWTDFEARTDWCEVMIENEDHNPLINGAIDPAMFDSFRQFLDSIRIKYSLELYDDQKTLIKEERSEN